MEHSMTFLVVLGAIALASAVGFDSLRRQFTKKRNDYRMGQALRRSILQPEGMQMRQGLRMVNWQSCDSSSVRFS